jgi:heme a synthase
MLAARTSANERALSGARLAGWVRRGAIAGVVLCFAVVVLGAYVRLTAAGLGCPDWPGCYGHVTPPSVKQSAAATAAYPNRPLEGGKAWREMIHRYAAGTLVCIVLVIVTFAIATRRSRLVSFRHAIALLAIVLFQALLGMLTVTWRLTPLVVTLHLLLGMTTLATLWWLWLSMPNTSRDSRSAGGRGTQVPVATPSRALRTAYWLALTGLAALILQIALGGWTSTNYAAVACPDFPTCQAAWWPQMDYGNAFVLWRGLGISSKAGYLTTRRVLQSI